MPELGDNLDFVKNQALNLRLQNLSTTYPSGSNTAGVMYFNTTNNLAYYINNSGTEVAFGGGVTAHNSLSGLTTGDAGHTQFVMLGGRAFGQVINGDTAAAGRLMLYGTSHTTPGYVEFSYESTGYYKGHNSFYIKQNLGSGTPTTSDTAIVFSGRVQGIDPGQSIPTQFGIDYADIQSASDPIAIYVADNMSGVTFSVSNNGIVTTPQLISTIITGTAPLSVVSTTQVANLNASFLAGRSWSDTASTNKIVSVGAGGKIASGYMSGVLAVTDLTTTNTGTGNNVLATSPTITMPTLAPSSGISANANSGRITNLATPTASTDAANKSYVDAIVQGLDVKRSVRGVIMDDVEVDGFTSVLPYSEDGITYTNGDRVLLVGKSNPAHNGIYTFVSDALIRSDDADTNAKVSGGMYVFVEEGTVYGDSGWVLTTNNPITLDTTALTFTQFSGAGQITAGAGMTKSGNTLNVVANGNGTIVVNADNISVSSALQALHSPISSGATGFLVVSNTNQIQTRTLTGTANRVTITNTGGVSGNPTLDVGSEVVVTTGSYSDPSWIAGLAGSKVSGNISGNAANVTGTVAVGSGGTGSTTKAGARADTGLADTGKRLAQISEHIIGNGSLTTIDITHNLNTTKISWNITKVSDGTQVWTTGRAYDANTLRLIFSAAPASNSLNVIVQG